MDSLHHLTKADKVYQIIMEGIISGELAPNERLVVSEIAKELSVSNIPVREALQRLENEGLAKSTPYVGVVVSTPSVTEMVEYIEIRAELEAVAAAASLPLLTDKDLAKVKELLLKMEECMHMKKSGAYSRADREFHWTLYSKCPNKSLLKLIEDLWTKTERARAIFHLAPVSTEISFEEHERILEFIEEKDYPSAVNIIHKQKIRLAQEIRTLFSGGMDGAQKGEGA